MGDKWVFDSLYTILTAPKYSFVDFIRHMRKHEKRTKGYKRRQRRKQKLLLEQRNNALKVAEKEEQEKEEEEEAER